MGGREEGILPGDRLVRQCLRDAETDLSGRTWQKLALEGGWVWLFRARVCVGPGGRTACGNSCQV